MISFNLSPTELREINQRAIKRLRAIEAASANGTAIPSSDPSWVSRMPNATFTHAEIRAGFLAAQEKLRALD